MARSALFLPRGRAEAPAVVAIRSLSLRAEPVERWAGLLEPGEIARAARFARPEDRDRHVLGRGLARQMLGDALRRDPRTLRFAIGRYGKPLLDAPDAPAFNVAHSGDMVLAAVAPGGRVGIDVERLDPHRDLRTLASRVFTRAECAALDAESRLERGFYRQWTRKEAVVKALGTGLSLDPLSFAICDRDGRLHVEADGADWGESCLVRDLDVGPAYSAALVILP